MPDWIVAAVEPATIPAVPNPNAAGIKVTPATTAPVIAIPVKIELFFKIIIFKFFFYFIKNK